MQDVQAIVTIIRDGGIIGLLVLIVASFFKGWAVPGWLFREVQDERDSWRGLALKGTHLAERGTELTSDSMRLLEERIAMLAASSKPSAKKTGRKQ